MIRYIRVSFKFIHKSRYIYTTEYIIIVSVLFHRMFSVNMSLFLNVLLQEKNLTYIIYPDTIHKFLSLIFAKGTAYMS